GPIPHPSVHLRRQHDFLTPPAALREPPPDDLLRPAFASLPTIHVCAVEKVEAEFQRPIHDGKTFGLTSLRTEVHRPKAEPAYLHSRTAKMNVLHGWGSYSCPRA